MWESFCVYVCVFVIKYNFVKCNTSTEKAYQINNRFDDSQQDMRHIQWVVSN